MRIVKNCSIYDLKNEEIGKIHQIASCGYPKKIYNDYYSSLKSPRDFEDLFNSDHLLDLFVTLGEDWFLFYATSESVPGVILIDDWVSTCSKEDMPLRIKEMLVAFKELLFNNRDSYILANLRHNTTFKLYTKMLEKGYIEQNPPFLNMVDVPDDAMDVICTNAERYPGIEDYLDSKESFFDPATNYVLHSVDFKFTDNFFEKFEKHYQKEIKK